MRIDKYLHEQGYATSRTEAKALLLEGAVRISGRVVTKPSFEINDDGAEIAVDRSAHRFASRGGEKLAFALSEFDISVEGKDALDVGASSGGFTDCLLQNGANRVIAVDSGEGQMVKRLREDGRVTVIENFNARYMTREDLHYVPTVAVMDVSFISATYIIPSVYSVLAPGGDFVCLIKPQFEVGRAYLSKGGIVKDSAARENALCKVVDFAKEIGFILRKTAVSPITGGDGNIEFLAYFVKDKDS